jgi:2-phospho-L-lactate/phosphoenolpyruvate guanylyltransferase
LTALAVLIPFKDAGVKSRLSGVMGVSERHEFALAMLRDVLGAFRAAGLAASCHVVTADAMAKDVAAKAGARLIPEPSAEGVNAAVRRGVEKLGPRTEYLVVPSDLPLLRRGDIRELLSMRGQGLDVVLVPSRAFDGTNALLFHGSGRIPLSYDDHSFWRHLEGAASLGMSLGVYSGDGVRFDVDTEDDFRALARTGKRRRSVTIARRALA